MTTIPELDTLVQAARDIVITARRQHDLGSLTVKTVRRQVERDFDLAEGVLDEGTTKTALRKAVNAALAEDLPVDEGTAEKRKRPSLEAVEEEKEVKPKKIRKGSKAESVTETPDVDEASGSSLKKKKKSRVVAKSKAMIVSDSEGDQGAPAPEPTASTSKATKKSKEATSKTAKSSKKAAVSVDAEKSESEHSALADEPAGGKRTKGKTKEGAKKTKAKKGKLEKAPEKELSPDEETIKRLKSLVSACGLRKPWSKEFANLPLPKEQIARLNEILTDLGMTGRYSLEQAKAIKEKRALARELNDVVEFERKAGASRGSRTKTQSSTKRRVGELDTNSEMSEGSNYEDQDSPVSVKKSTASKSIMAYLANQSSGEE